MRLPTPAKRGHRFIRFLPLAAGLILFAGCAAPDVNPPAARAGRGYVDFFAEDPGPLCWEIQRLEVSSGKYKALYSRLDPYPDDVLRLALAPGRHQLRVRFLNRLILEPATFQIDVVEGRVVPVEIDSTEAGSVMVETRGDRVGPTARGRVGRAKKLGIHEGQMYRLSAAPREPLPYEPKEKRAYTPGAE